MKRRSFQEYLEKRLNKDEIAEIKAQALREKNALQAMQEEVVSQWMFPLERAAHAQSPCYLR